MATDGSIDLANNPIFSQGVIGLGYQNAADQLMYANNYVQLSGSMGCQLTSGQPFNAVKAFAFTNRGSTSGTNINIYPAGNKGFEGKGWCESLSFQCGQDSVVQCSMNYKSYVDGQNNKIVTGNATNSETGVSGDNVLSNLGGYNALFPYWGTTCSIDGTDIADVMDWSAQYSSSIEMLKCCGTGGAYKDNEGAPLAPDYIAIGTMQGGGSLTIFSIVSDLAPINMHDQRKNFVITITSPSQPGTSHRITIPTMVLNSGGTSIQTGAGWISAQLQFSALGDGKKPPVSLD